LILEKGKRCDLKPVNYHQPPPTPGIAIITVFGLAGKSKFG